MSKTARYISVYANKKGVKWVHTKAIETAAAFENEPILKPLIYNR